MAGPSNVVANASPIPTEFFPNAVRVQMQAVGNTGTLGSHSVDYAVVPPQPTSGTIGPPSKSPGVQRFMWPWEHWAPFLKMIPERFR